jgi:D-alanyl-D-alanine dipeptidase/CubicO group peptidase (beta-lactamase class C family)
MNNSVPFRRAALSALLALCSWPQSASAQQGQRQAPKATIAALEKFIAHEMATKQVPGVAIALVEGRHTMWSRGFGGISAETPFRAGDISKLFAAVAVMQLVDRGKLNLDMPMGRLLPDLRPRNPYGKAFTLRQLLADRSGLVSEPPVGSRHDDKPPALSQTVLSLNDTELVYEPGTHTLESDAGFTTAGYLVERLLREPFARVVAEHLLAPLGMRQSSFDSTLWVTGGQARPAMWTYDGRHIDVPTFAPGTIPATNLVTTVADLAEFIKMLIARGEAPGGMLLKRESLEEMWRRQFSDAPLGLGFELSEMHGRRVVGRGGSIYGFAAELELLPEDGLGVVVYATRDRANAVTRRIAEAALEWLLLEREGKVLPPPEITSDIPAETGAALSGSRYRTGANSYVHLEYQDGRLYATPFPSGVRDQIRVASSGKLIADGSLAFGTPLDTAPANRIDPGKPQAPPARWTGLIGEYGKDFSVVYVLERGGRLTLLTDWFFYDALEEVNSNSFRLRAGRHEGEEVVFTRDARGRGAEVRIGGSAFARRPEAAAPGGTYRIVPLRPVNELRAEAAKAHPPAQPSGLEAPELVEIARLEPGIRLDIRYATTNNFMTTAFYTQARALLQKPAAEALARVHRSLAAQGCGLLVHDAYRPWSVTYMFWEATPTAKRQFVADPSQGSRHNRGCAVDLTLYDLKTGFPVQMTGVYDEMSERSYPYYPGGTGLERWQRDLLRHAMEAQGFTVEEHEWWHFDYKDWARYPVLNVPFENLN